MDIQKRINRFIRKFQDGGKHTDVMKFQKLVKIAEDQGRQIIISIDSPGGTL